MSGKHPKDSFVKTLDGILRRDQTLHAAQDPATATPAQEVTASVQQQNLEVTSKPNVASATKAAEETQAKARFSKDGISKDGIPR